MTGAGKAGILRMLVMAATLCSWLSVAAPLYAQESEIRIDNAAAYERKERPAVFFSHETHMETYECLDCHHDYQDGENVLNEDELDEESKVRCAACHTENASIKLAAAYHRQCIGCHRRVNKQDASRLPVTCAECHPRNPATP